MIIFVLVMEGESGAFGGKLIGRNEEIGLRVFKGEGFDLVVFFFLDVSGDELVVEVNESVLGFDGIDEFKFG